MIFSYDGLPFEFVEFDTFERRPVYDKWNVGLTHVEWTVGMLTYYSPTGLPAGVAVEQRRAAPPATATPPVKNPAPGFLRRLKTYLLGTDASPTVTSLRRDVASNRVNLGPPDRGTLGAFASGKAFGPIITDATLRNRLMTPRRPLRIYGPDWSGVDADLVSTPRENEECDPTGGPFCLQADIVSSSPMGFVVYLRYKFATLPCEDASARLVLSHRYDASEVGSDSGYGARRIEGEIVFNGAMVHTHHITPDAFRSQFFLPIPLGHRRVVEFVRARGDGLQIEYAYTDTDQTITFDPGDSGAVGLEISEKVGFYSPTMQNTQIIGFKPMVVVGGMTR